MKVTTVEYGKSLDIEKFNEIPHLSHVLIYKIELSQYETICKVIGFQNSYELEKFLNEKCVGDTKPVVAFKYSRTYEVKQKEVVTKWSIA